MYQVIDNNIIAITVNDWCKAGLSYNQFNHDAKDGYLTIVRRGLNGNTLIDVKSIKRPERRRVIERIWEDRYRKSGTKVDIQTRIRYKCPYFLLNATEA